MLVAIGALTLVLAVAVGLVRPQSREPATHAAMAGVAIIVIGFLLVACV